jgi:hypothetical protein
LSGDDKIVIATQSIQTLCELTTKAGGGEQHRTQS